MRKLPILAITAIAAVGITANSAQAFSIKQNNSKSAQKYVITGQVNKNNVNNLNKKFQSLGIDIQTINWNNCQVNKPSCVLPNLGSSNNCKPDNKPNKPNKPETPDNKPEIPDNKPEIPDNKPDNKPETPEEDNTVSGFAAQVVKLVNKEREKAGLAPLSLDKNIEKAALVRAKEIEKSFSHTRPNGTSFSTALTEANVKFSGSGENIAWGQKSPEQVMEGWMNSPGHKANILNKNYKSIGVGHYQNNSGTSYWTQLFTY